MKLETQKANLQQLLTAQAEILNGNSHWVDVLGKPWGKTHSANISAQLREDFGDHEAELFERAVAKYNALSDAFWIVIDEMVELEAA